MRRRFGRFAALFVSVMVVGATASVVLAAPASATPGCGSNCYVAPGGNDGNSGTVGSPWATVQFAVNNVSAGGTVNLAAGTYTEQVVISQPVTLVGAGQASTTIQGPAVMVNSSCIPLTSGQPTRAVVTVCGSAGSTVVMSGVTISGGVGGEDADSSCNPLIDGVWISSGETLNLSQSTVTNVYNTLAADWGCQQGIGIRAGSNALGLVGNLIANQVTVQDYQKGGIVIDGPGSSGTITDSTVSGDPAITPFIAMNGIEIGRGASASITGTTVSGNVCRLAPVCGPNPVTQTQSAGILLFDNVGQPAPTVSVTNNIVTGNDIGVYSGQLSGTTLISGNSISSSDEGVLLDEGSATVTNNTIENNTVDGVFASQGDEELANTTATLTYNTISDNPIGIEATDVCPGPHCASANPDPFTVDLAAHNNAIDNNPTLGVSNDTPTAFTVDATCNWWGAASGPGPVGPGTGDGVSTAVTFANWLVTSNLSGPCSGVPAAPTITLVYDGPAPYSGNSEEVAFTLAASGGSATSETVTCVSLAGGPAGIATGTGSPIFVGGPAVGPYQCTVTATNAYGTSPPSAPYIVLLGGTGDCPTIPTAPTLLSTGPGNSSATVSWAPSTGCVAGYVVTPYIGGVAQRSVLIPGPGTTTVMYSLTNGAAYTFTVAAENGQALSPLSTMSGPITAGAPAVVTGLRVTRVGKSALKVKFGVPANNGAPIMRYTATCTSTNGGAPNGKTAKAGPLTVTGLSAGKTYTCTVKATNARGTGPTSHTSATIKA